MERADGDREESGVAIAWPLAVACWSARCHSSTSQRTAPVTPRMTLAPARATLVTARMTAGWSWSAAAWAGAWPLSGWSAGRWSTVPAGAASRAASRATVAYSASARASQRGPERRWMVSRATTVAARVTVSRPRYESPGAEGSWSRTWARTARKPLMVRLGHHQRPNDRAAWRGRGPGPTSGAQLGACQPWGGWPQPMRRFTSSSFTNGLVRVVGGAAGHGRVQDDAAAPGLGWAGWSGRPAPAAEGEDGFAEMAAGGALSGGLGAAIQGDAAGQAGHRPGAVAHVDQPDGASSHEQAPSRGADGVGVRAGR